MSEIKLKRCPFCGGEAKIKYCNYGSTVYIECDICGSRTADEDVSTEYCARDEVIKVWNRRVEE